VASQWLSLSFGKFTRWPQWSVDEPCSASVGSIRRANDRSVASLGEVLRACRQRRTRRHVKIQTPRCGWSCAAKRVSGHRRPAEPRQAREVGFGCSCVDPSARAGTTSTKSHGSVAKIVASRCCTLEAAASLCVPRSSRSPGPDLECLCRCPLKGLRRVRGSPAEAVLGLGPVRLLGPAARHRRAFGDFFRQCAAVRVRRRIPMDLLPAGNTPKLFGILPADDREP